MSKLNYNRYGSTYSPGTRTHSAALRLPGYPGLALERSIRPNPPISVKSLGRVPIHPKAVGTLPKLPPHKPQAPPANLFKRHQR